MPKVPIYKRRTDLPPDPLERNVIAPKFAPKFKQKQLSDYRKPFKKSVEV